MEFLITTTSIVLLFGLISSPIILFVGLQKWKGLKRSFLSYLILGLLITAVITWIFAWWTDYSDLLLMSHYGYDFNAMNETGRFSKVADENLERVKQLEISYLGTGWPLQAIIAFIFYSPYLLLVYPFGQLVIKKKIINST